MGDEKLEFNHSQAMASPFLDNACYQVNMLEKVVLEEMKTLSTPSDPLEACLIGTYDNGFDSHPEKEKEAYAKILKAQRYLPKHPPRKIFNIEVRLSNEDNKVLSRWN